MRVATKAEYLRRAGLGLLGNSMPSWPDVAAAKAAGHRGPVMIRSRTPNSPFMRPDVPIDEADAVIDGLVALGASRPQLYLTWMSPAVGRRLNAELWRSPAGLYLHYSTDQTHVRAALDGPNARHAEGSAALAVLRWACDENSYDDLMEFLDLYPDAVIELTAFDREVGDIPGRRVVVWEVRDY